MESNDSPEIPDRGETSDIPGLPSGCRKRQLIRLAVGFTRQNSAAQSVDHQHSGVSPMCPCIAVLTDRCVLWTDSQPDVSLYRRAHRPMCLMDRFSARCVDGPMCHPRNSVSTDRRAREPTCPCTNVLTDRHGPMYPYTNVLTSCYVHVLGPV